MERARREDLADLDPSPDAASPIALTGGSMLRASRGAGATLDHGHGSALSGGMIALTDAGLSCLIEAAKVIEPRARHRWLQNLADELDPSPNARRRARWRRWYHNDKAGVATVRVRYSGVGLANLIIGGWLRAHDEAYTDEEISKAIGSLIEYGNLPRKPNAIG